MKELNVEAPWIASVIQGTPIPFDQRRTLAKVNDLVASAASRKARLVVFPEAFVGGYPKGHVFGSYVGGRSDEGRDAYRQYWEAAIDVPGPCVDELAAIAGRHGVHMVIGVIERDAGTLYCCVLFFSATGAFLGKHRKLMPTGAERMIWGYGDGSTMPVLDTPLGKLGAVICWENYMPMMRTAMYAKGIQLYCAPTADSRPTWVASMQHIAIEGRCYVLASNQFLRRSDFPDTYTSLLGNDPEAVVQNGGSCIVDPFGQILAGPAFGEEVILTAEIDLRNIARGKFDFDVTGHYSRPDVFRLTVDERRQTPVTVVPAIHQPETPREGPLQ
ncbi:MULTISPECIES: nitrilase-related carbon-nitrogen hydrolase [unclassified Burkholderia]|uniref:nitrilase-related carbon-nitrogen hydrolase n=1 Tax=unclassified Burkholderia TaxID=2613784 RepID=UPI001963569D|nr:MULTISPECIES: nitrilase-related carbon-nitrogen hydrolase [unclassified Burkholderia]NIE82373.1 nitrilase [Burkholderia sp. Tr-860]NIF61659.1 nitrilase [Burkholderia sp. Cy-647]NIF96181.1 nitrilase [Burkholderia sp. Ax-1720]